MTNPTKLTLSAIARHALLGATVSLQGLQNDLAIYTRDIDPDRLCEDTAQELEFYISEIQEVVESLKSVRDAFAVETEDQKLRVVKMHFEPEEAQS